MNDAIPHGVLSDQLSDAMTGKKLLAAVFVTFRFDPAFFERHVLPVFFDVPVSRAEGPIPLIQLAEALQEVPGGVAVYYDEGGLDSSSAEKGSARLDIRRLRVSRRNGIFHPKNVFLLVQDDVDDDAVPPQVSLLVVTLSANLTQAGWWENVEVCHIETLVAGADTRMKDGLLDFFKTLEKDSPHESDHRSLRAIRKFVSSLNQRGIRLEEGRILPHFYGGNVPVVDFLKGVAGQELKGLNLEIVSPYFDGTGNSPPLDALLAAFRPRETRVFLPRRPDGSADVAAALFDDVDQREDVFWSRLPGELLRRGKADEAAARTVHAKVYRFFQVHPKKEFLFVGSVNLTRAAHQGSGNLETGVFVELKPPRRPAFWLDALDRRPAQLQAPTIVEDEVAATDGKTPLTLVFDWKAKSARAWWAARDESPTLQISALGVFACRLDPLPGRTWTALSDASAAALEKVLLTTSIVDVAAEGGEPVKLLVEEAGMYKKPSLISLLSLADILKYWALLTTEQRNAFLEARLTELLDHEQGRTLVERSRPSGAEDSVFDRFTGIFHSFDCLARRVRDALHEDNERDAVARLFGCRIDSLGGVLERALTDDPRHDAVDRYVVLLCARQMCSELRRQFPEFWATHRDDVADIERALKRVAELRAVLLQRGGADMDVFLDFFETWFLKRAAPVVAGGEAA